MWACSTKRFILLYIRFHFDSARQRIADGRRPLRRSRLLLVSRYPYRYATMRQMIALANLSTEYHQTIQVKINWDIAIHQSLNQFLSFHFFILLVRLQLRTVRFERRYIFLVERQERSGPVFLGRQQFQRPHLSVRHRPQLHRILCDLQLPLCCARSTYWCRYSVYSPYFNYVIIYMYT